MVAILWVGAMPSLTGYRLGQQSCELLKRTGFARSHDHRSRQQILQIVIAVAGFSPRMELRFLHSLQLSVEHPVISSSLHVSMPNPLYVHSCRGSETVRRSTATLTPASRPPGSDRIEGIPAELFQAWCFCFPPATRRRTSRRNDPQRVELLVVKLGQQRTPTSLIFPSHSTTMTQVHVSLAGTRNGPSASIDRHYTRDITRPRSLVMNSDNCTQFRRKFMLRAVFPVIDRAEMIQRWRSANQRIVDLIILIAPSPHGSHSFTQIRTANSSRAAWQVVQPGGREPLLQTLTLQEHRVSTQSHLITADSYWLSSR